MTTDSPARPLPARRRSRALGLALLVGLVTAWYGHAAWHRLRTEFHGNYSGFIQMSAEWYDDNPLVENLPQIRATLWLLPDYGYDGQFMYYMAFDPFMRQFDSYRRVVDNPPYRYGRIGYSLLIKLFSGNHWRRFPATMLALVIGGVALATGALGGLGVETRAGPAVALLVAVIPGFWESLQTVLPEPIAAAFILVGFWLLAKRSTTGAALCFAASLLVRETGLTFVALAAGAEFLAGRRAKAVQLVVIACAPILLWRTYVTWAEFPIYGIGGFFVQPHTFGVPFGGILDSWRAIASHEYYPSNPAMATAAIAYSILILASLATAVVLAAGAPSPATLAAVVYAVMAVSLTYDAVWGNVSGTARVTFEVFLALAIATTGWRSLPPKLKLGLGAFWTLSAAYVLVFAADAEGVRQAAKLWAW